MGRKKLKPEYCKYCNADTAVINYPIWSTIIGDYFCNLECYNKYKKDYQQKKEKNHEI